MLISTYNPDSQAQCPKCKKLVHCYLEGGITFGYNPYLELYHQECNTTWKYYLNTGEKVIKE